MAQRYMNEELGTRPCSFISGNKLIGFPVQCNRYREKISAKAHLFNLRTMEAMDRIAGEA
jgi:hypothetical protein